MVKSEKQRLHLEKLNSNPKAHNNCNWKGGRTIKDGYVAVRCENHPKATKFGYYVLEHILVMENILGRYLNNDEVVHHINGIRYDNRPENLVVMKRNKHVSYHQIISHKNNKRNQFRNKGKFCKRS
jgi:hypothetical protein